MSTSDRYAESRALVLKVIVYGVADAASGPKATAQVPSAPAVAQLGESGALPSRCATIVTTVPGAAVPQTLRFAARCSSMCEPKAEAIRKADVGPSSSTEST